MDIGLKFRRNPNFHYIRKIRPTTTHRRAYTTLLKSLLLHPQKFFALEGQGGCKVAANILRGFDCSTVCMVCIKLTVGIADKNRQFVPVPGRLANRKDRCGRPTIRHGTLHI